MRGDLWNSIEFYIMRWNNCVKYCRGTLPIFIANDSVFEVFILYFFKYSTKCWIAFSTDGMGKETRRVFRRHSFNLLKKLFN